MSEQSLTPWFPASVKPVRVGEYNASCLRNPTILRWWNGRHWSVDYQRDHDEKAKDACRKERTVTTGIEWRGLSENPEALRWPYNSKMQNVAKGGR